MSNLGAPPIGVALLGYGAIAEFHATALHELGARLVVVAGPRHDELRAFADRHGFSRAETDPRTAIEMDGVDAVVVASPSALHAEQAQMALASGRHVLVEIPLALSLAEGTALVDLASARGLELGVCHTERFSESLRFAMAQLDLMGDLPVHVVTQSMLRRRMNIGWTGRRRSWTDDLLWHHGGHAIDLTLQLLGATKVSVASVSGPRQDEGGPLDHGIVLRTSDGRIGTIALSYNSLIDRHDVLVVTEVETLLLSNEGVTCSGRPGFKSRPDAFEQAVRAQAEAFLNAIRGGRPFPSSGAALLTTLRIQAEIARGI